ncbi:BnaC02g03510D, partial [Brassica napus]
FIVSNEYMVIYCFGSLPDLNLTQGLQENIKLVPIDLPNRPAWFKEKVNPANKVPALEHNGKIMGESLDLIKYVDSNFEGPSLYPLDPEKRDFGEDMLKYVDTTFTKVVFGSFKGDPAKDTASVFNHLENALQKFDGGPFFLGDLSLVDVAYIPFVQRFQVFLGEVFKYDITAGRPKLAAWIEEMNKMVAYTQTITESGYVINFFKKFMCYKFLDLVGLLASVLNKQDLRFAILFHFITRDLGSSIYLSI